MGNSCSSIGCSENSQFISKENETREQVNDPNSPLFNKLSKHHKNSFDNNCINLSLLILGLFILMSVHQIHQAAQNPFGSPM